MAIEIRVPTLGESVTEATVGQWFKKAGDVVAVDEPIVELETDKVTVEVPAPSAGVLGALVVAEGDTVEVGALLGAIGDAVGGGASAEAPVSSKAPEGAAVAVAPQPDSEAAKGEMPAAPAAGKMMRENNIDIGQVAGSGKRGQVLKEDVVAHLAASKSGTATNGGERWGQWRGPQGGDNHASGQCCSCNAGCQQPTARQVLSCPCACQCAD